VGILDYAELTLEEKAARGLPLPDKLSIYDIVNLWVTTDRDRAIYYQALNNAYNDGKGSLRGTEKYKDPFTQDEPNGLAIFGPYTFHQNIYITVNDFLDWLKNEDEPLPTDCLLANWWKELESQNEIMAIDGALREHEAEKQIKENQQQNEELSKETPPQVKTDADTQFGKPFNERELTKWLRETWIKEEKPGGSAFFDGLKKYVGKNESPICEHFTTSKKGAGIRWNTGGATSYMTKKAIQNSVSRFKKTTQ
jgi:hypothetical protein